MIASSSSSSEPARIDAMPVTSEGGASRYDPSLTGWRRFTAVIAPGIVLAGIGSATWLIGGIDLPRKAKEQSLKIFAVGLPPRPPPEPSSPAPPVKVPVVARPQPVVPRTPSVVTPPVIAIPAHVSNAAAPAQPQVATSSAPPAAEAAPAYVANPTCSIATPAYPARARRLQQTGTVRIAVTIDASGRIVDETVRKSSGHDALDEAALATVRAGRCRPNANGLAITSVLPIAFTLDR